MKRTLLFLLSFFSISATHAQFKSILPPTPNAAELGKYGQIPVDLFNGLPQISVPLHTISVKDIVVPLQLTYHASGMRTEQHPTWVGLGWNLSGMGAITRVVNGRKDETQIGDISASTGLGFSPGHIFGYYDVAKLLEGDSWSTQGTLTSFVGGNEQDAARYLDGEPDEYIVNAPGLSASFYIYKDSGGKINYQVKSKDGRKLKIEPDFKSTDLATPELTISFYDVNDEIHFQPFFKFTITTEDGKKYIFGGKSNAIDFLKISLVSNQTSMPTTWYLTSIQGVSGGSVNYEYLKNGTPLVVNKTRTKILAATAGGGIHCEGWGCGGPYDDESISIQNPSYLSKITASDGTIIDFLTSASHELPYEDFTSDGFLSDQIAHSVLVRNTVLAQNYWMKLDEIDINNKNVIKLAYIDSPTERLKLQTCSFLDLDNNISDQYTFSYNPNKLPPYNSRQSDNWGFYNGKSYGTLSFDDLYAFRSPDAILMQNEMLTSISYPTGGSTSFEYEEHDYSKVVTQSPMGIHSENGHAGGLRIKKITSTPISGSLQGAIVKEYSYLNADNSSSGILSGIPVYVATGTHHVSYSIGGWSGLLYSHVSTDFSESFIEASENYLNQLGNTDGNHVTYSRVIEKMTGNGQTIYTYTNHDQFPDEDPVNIYTNLENRTLSDPYISHELERGLLLKKEVLTETNLPVETEQYSYNIYDPVRLNSFVKVISKNIIAGNDPAAPIIRMVANKIYTFFPYLKEKTTQSFDSNGTLSSTLVTDFQYDLNNQLIAQTETNSQGNTIIQKNYYAGQYAVAGNIYDQMNNANMIGVPVEKLTLIQKGTANALITQGSIKTFNNTNPGGFILPQEEFSLEIPKPTNPTALTTTTGTSTGLTFDNAFKSKLSYKYDLNGNLINLKRTDGINMSYQWGYNNIYPVTECKNGDNTEFMNLNFEDDNTAATGVAHSGNRFHLGSYTVSWTVPNSRHYLISYWYRNSNIWKYSSPVTYTGPTLALSGGDAYDDIRIYPIEAELTTLTFEPLTGVTSVSDPKGLMTSYNYDNFQRLNTISDFQGNILKSYNYNYLTSVTLPPYNPDINDPSTLDNYYLFARPFNGDIQVVLNSTVTGTVTMARAPVDVTFTLIYRFDTFFGSGQGDPIMIQLTLRKGQSTVMAKIKTDSTLGYILDPNAYTSGAIPSTLPNGSSFSTSN